MFSSSGLTSSYNPCSSCSSVSPLPIVSTPIYPPCPCEPAPNPCCIPAPPPCIPAPPPCIPAPQPSPVDVRIVDERGPKIELLESQLRDAQHQLAMAEDLEEKLRRQIQESQAKGRFAIQKETQVGMLEAEIARLKQQIFEGDMRLVNSEGQRAAASEAIQKLEHELQLANSRLAQARQQEMEMANLQRQLMEAQNRIHFMEGEAKKGESGMSSLEAQLGTANDRLFQMKSSFENERGQFRQQLSDAQERLRHLEQQWQEAVNQCRFLEKKLQEATDRLNHGDKSSSQMKAQWESEKTALQGQLYEAQQRFNASERQLVEASNRVSFLEGKLREAESRLSAADQRIASLQARIQALELEIANLRARLTAKPELHSQTNIKETYKVKSFEIAAKLAVMDGTDDGMYNGLPIEVEGEGLYRDLVAAGRRPRTSISGTGSMGKLSETYKVQSYELAERLSKMSGSDDGMYNGLAIEVVGLGLYNDLRRSGYGGGAGGGGAAGGRIAGGAAGGAAAGFAGGAAGGASGAIGSATAGQVKGGETYIVTSMDIAATLSRMSGSDDGTYKGLPIEVKGMGLYRDLRGKK